MNSASFIAANPTVRPRLRPMLKNQAISCSKEMICIAQNTESVVSEGLKKH